MYVRMAREAKEEGFMDLAKRFEGVAKIESIHERRYLDFLDDVKKRKVFKRAKSIV
jgi:rubrerythrin